MRRDIMGDILKEAIADAKAVRETALQNAKVALEEAFTPKIQSMLSSELKEMDLEEDDFGGEEEEFGDEEEVDAPIDEPELDDLGGEEEVDPEKEELKAEIKNELKDEIKTELKYEIEGEDELGDEEELGGEEEFGDEEETEEGLDLEAIIRELEGEIEEELRNKIGLGESDEESGETVEESSDEETVDEVSKDRNEGDPSGPAKDGSNSTNEDFDIEIDEAILDEDEDEDEDKEEVDEEVDESSGIGSGTGRGSTDRSSAIGGSGQEKAQAMESIQAELTEYKEAVSFLKDKLHEVNILNAKLLFTNKLFKEFALDNNQKLKVVETFDRAQTTREIKLVYTTLGEQFGDNGSINRKTVNESASSKAGSTKPKSNKKVITEEAQVANRFRKLAGLVK